MTASNELTLKTLPSTPPMLLQAAITRKKPGKTPRFPAQILEVANIRTNSSQLRRYNQACGFSDDNAALSVSFLHVQAFRLHMKMMLSKDFPLAPMGCVHLSNTIIQHRPVLTNEVIRLRCSIADNKVTDKGYEFTFHCEAFCGDELVWEDDSRYLSRAKTGVASAPKGERAEPRRYANTRDIDISRSDARKYARASGDFNPIHLHDISAKILGFKRMVIHGMWSKAACLAALSGDIAGTAYRCHVEFKTPIFLPARVRLEYEAVGSNLDFELRNKSGVKPHLIGSIQPL
ncbi:MaoC family dehydratase [Zhongshania sp. BJYM1]|uniref:MaoC family dehydratase n=1 Tax=Zhongshania aquatica TaxID=2965069 RepID=UPI0022B4EF7F|nr:MaoC family dehydratase [Marortus sp. BJYM1]